MGMEAVKLRHKETGLYSTGGMYYDWTKRGRTWPSVGALKCSLVQLHLHSYRNEHGVTVTKNNIPEEWEIVRLTEEGITTFNAREAVEQTNPKLKKQRNK